MLITGKSGTMLPCTASTSAGQLFRDGSLILQRSRRFSGPVRIQWRISPRHPSTAPSAQRSGGRGGMGTRCEPGPRPDVYGSDQPQRFANFIDSDLHSPQYIAFLVDRHLKRNRVISRIRMVAPNVPVHARSAAGDADDSQVSGFVRTQNASSFQPVAGGVRGFDDPHQIGEFPLEDFQDIDALINLVRTSNPDEPLLDKPCHATAGCRLTLRSGKGSSLEAARHARWR